MSTDLSASSLDSEAFNEKLQEPEPISAPLTPEQIAIVKATAPVLKEHGVAITSLFYQNMLNAHPELHNIFNKTSQVTGAQPRALAAAVFAYATYVDDLGKLKAAVERISHKHTSLTVQPEHYAIVGKFLIEAVAIVLGDAVTPEVAEAWTAAYATLADVFINREKQIYAGYENWQGWRKFKIQKKAVESSEITSFYLEPQDGQPLPSFKPGQFVSVQIFIPELGHMQPRQYSLSEEPRSDYYRISVKKETAEQNNCPGLVSNALHANYQEGDTIELTHPTGDFFADSNAGETSPMVLVSAGVGVTPMMSILNSTISTGSTRAISWIHGTRSADSQAFADHIRSITQKRKNVTATVFRSNDPQDAVRGTEYHFDGRIDLGKLDQKKDLFLDTAETKYYTCGPPSFMEDVRTYLVKAGVSEERINLEVFGVGDGN